MKSARWQTITRIFEEALDKPRHDREQFVRQACRGDAELESEVVRLLAADEGAGTFLEGNALSTLPPRTNDLQHSILAPGSLISGRFEILRFIGQGGMGQVYEAFDLELKGKIALKTIREDISADPRMISRFRREVLLTRRITHPNVCRTFDIERHSSTVSDGNSQELTFLTMELLEGETLADFLARRHRLTWAEALPLVLQMIDGLSAAHSVGIVHRDFKPSNVILVPVNDALRVVVTDFGLARAILPNDPVSLEHAVTSLTGNQGVLGTLVYMAPEQFERGEVTIASDIYSLGLVMYEMVTGQRPFAGAAPFTEAVKRIKQPAPSPRTLAPDLDSRWESAICKCLQAQPEDRFGNVLEVAESITASEGKVPSSVGVRAGQSQKHLKTLAPSIYRSGMPWRKVTAILAICLSTLSLLVVLLRHYQVKADAKLTSGATVLLTEIQNNTGDKRFDNTTELVRHQLLQSPYFSLMDSSRIRDSLEEMKQPPNSPLVPTTARGVALRNGVPRIIFGTVSRAGDSYTLDIEIERPDNDTHRARAQWENHWTWNVSSETSEQEISSGFLNAVREGSDWMRSEVGESANDISRVDAPPQDVTTDNWTALSEFVQAEEFKSAGQVDDAVVALHNAISSDPHFALAYTRLGDLLVSIGRSDEGYRAYRSALAQEQQQRLTRREKDRLAGVYASDTEDFRTADTVFRDYAVYYPNDYLGWFYRAYPLLMLGRPEEAIASLERAAAIDPQRMFAPAHIARFDLVVGNFADASKWIQHLRDTKHSNDADLVEGEAAFLRNEYDRALSLFARLKESNDPHYRSYAFSLEARTYAELGQYRSALDALEYGITEDVKAGDVAQRANKIFDRAYINLKLARYERCMKDALTAFDLDRSFQSSLTAATLLGRAASGSHGELKKQIAVELRRIESQTSREDFKPLSDIVWAHLRGEILLADGNWNNALEEFRKADRLEAPARDKDYLARSLLAAAQHSSDKVVTARLRQEALSAYLALVSRPGQVWQWAVGYPPGYLSDQIFAFVTAASPDNKVDAHAKSELNKYLNFRSRADTHLHDVEEAKRLASSPVFTKTN
jgi:serine/threonine protein kinase/Tfp pilus assembly protein PilF